jgi:hypothetical protein
MSTSRQLQSSEHFVRFYHEDALLVGDIASFLGAVTLTLPPPAVRTA